MTAESTETRPQQSWGTTAVYVFIILFMLAIIGYGMARTVIGAFDIAIQRDYQQAKAQKAADTTAAKPTSIDATSKKQ